jgi:hypothetical protein
MIPTNKSKPNTFRNEAHKNPTKRARKRRENPTSYKWEIDATMKASIQEKSNPTEQGNEKQSGWMVWLETLELIYMSPLRARQKTTLPLALKL